MTAISPKNTLFVLVTGANGYVAMHIVEALLEQGYRVRATVCSQSKGKHIKKTFESFGDKLEIITVEDIAVPGASDKALQSVDAVAYTAASIVHAEDPQGMFVLRFM
jgi:nucleoside-diphosphate-sugar epimerase